MINFKCGVDIIKIGKIVEGGFMGNIKYLVLDSLCFWNGEFIRIFYIWEYIINILKYFVIIEN